MKRIRLLLVGLLATALNSPAVAHGMTPELEAVIVVTIVGMCRADQPSLASDLDTAFAWWKLRNGKYLVVAEKGNGEEEFKKAVAEIEESYRENRPFSKAYCQMFISHGLGEEGDIHED